MTTLRLLVPLALAFALAASPGCAKKRYSLRPIYAYPGMDATVVSPGATGGTGYDDSYYDDYAIDGGTAGDPFDDTAPPPPSASEAYPSPRSPSKGGSSFYSEEEPLLELEEPTSRNNEADRERSSFRVPARRPGSERVRSTGSSRDA